MLGWGSEYWISITRSSEVAVVLRMDFVEGCLDHVVPEQDERRELEGRCGCA